MDTTLILIAAIAVAVILLIICIVKTSINSSRINELLDYAEDGDLTGTLKDYYEKVDTLASKLQKSSSSALSERLLADENKLKQSYSKMAVVNFDAFDDITGKMSFALTLLNDTNSGFIITSLYGHNSCNTYVREVIGGVSAVKLIDEEKLSLAKAVKNVKEG